jgi:hypothetical protein
MSARTMKEITDFVCGTVVTELHVPDNDYPHYYVGETLMAQYLEPGACDPFKQIGFTVERCGVAVDPDYYEEKDMEIDLAVHDIVQKNSASLTATIAAIKALSSHISIVRL